MSPRVSTLLVLIGVLLAGLPLPALMRQRQESPAAEETRAEAKPSTRQTYATLQCSGQPTQLRLLHAGRELATLGAEELALQPVELELELPAHRRLELEAIATWVPSGQAQALSITLEPEGAPSRSCTQWAEAGLNTLHSIFTFSW